MLPLTDARQLLSSWRDRLKARADLDDLFMQGNRHDEQLETINAKLDTLTTLVNGLVAAAMRPDCSQRDTAWLLKLAELIDDGDNVLEFASSDVVDHARVNYQLEEALTAAALETDASAIGTRLRDIAHESGEVEGFTLRRNEKSRTWELRRTSAG